METTMRLTFSSPIEAADAQRRVISGVVVPFNKVGNTSAGPVIFESGSIEIRETQKIKLLAQHEKTNPIGRALSFQYGKDEIRGSFKVSASQKGTDYLILASEDLIGGLSVGVSVVASKPGKDGILYVQKAVLEEVSVVESPAFPQAVVTEVAASEQEEEHENSETVSVSEETIQPNESEAPMSEDTAAIPEATVEASRETIKASVPYSSQTVRHGITSFSRYVEHKSKATFSRYGGGDFNESELWIKAAEDPRNVTAADSTTTNPAFIPIQYLRDFVSNTNFGRPAVDAVSKGVLPAHGMTINIPSLVTTEGGGTDTAPSVDVAPELQPVADDPMTSSYISVPVVKQAGTQIISLELLERSDPTFWDELSIQLQRAYLQASDQYLITEIRANATTPATGYAATIAGLISYLATESTAAYDASSYFADRVIANSAWWTEVMGALDATGRPIFTASQPWNAGGQTSSTSLRGNLLGLDLYVDRLLPKGLVSESAFVLSPDVVKFWESPTMKFDVNLVQNGVGSSMAVNTSLYAYNAAKVLIPGGIREFKLA